MRDFAAGVGFLFKGQRWVFKHTRWWGFGMIPALITLVGYVAAMAALVVWSDDIADWATPFADDWDPTWRGLLRGTLVAAVVGGGTLVSVVTFTAVTLLVGQPFYEALAAKVDETEGGAPAAPDVPLWRELLISARDSLTVLLRVIACGLVLFALGFIPVVGQTVVPALGFCVSGYFLVAELSAVALQRRGVPQKERLRMLRRRLGLPLGFGVPLVLLFLVPLVTVLAMPGAVAGATLLARELVPVEDEGADDTDPDDADEAGDRPQWTGEAPGADRAQYAVHPPAHQAYPDPSAAQAYPDPLAVHPGHLPVNQARPSANSDNMKNCGWNG
ncbi:EI24 domain-containing protein [Kitasatospora camelliae]|uniref:EI24 domain-containing protein n=1 Tax=Kitasatospora camelliae TaxID=3156397 RepID=A0AAU8K1V3_9ACTN